MGFLANILNWLRGRVSPKGYSPPYLEAENPENWEPFSEDSSSEVMLAEYYDKHLFERARTQWQFGDWESLARIERESLNHHPQRASLALLAAAGHQQSGNMEATREFTHLAKEWGASRKMISQVLIAGVYNTLGKASSLCGQQQRALNHFKESFCTAGDGGDVRLLTQARAARQGVGGRNGTTSYIASSQNAIQQFSPDYSKTPRFIVINGMVRSGSTVAMKIVSDLLSKVGLPFVKYYIDDFEDIKKIEDHILQNENICFVLKTHKLNDEIKKIVKRFEGKYIYTKRDLCEVAASLSRMSKVKESPFYRENGIGLEEIMMILKRQIEECEMVKKLASCIIFSTEDFRKEKLVDSVEKISEFLGIIAGMSDIESVVQKNFQEVNASFSKNITLDDVTSLGHHKDNFFHKNHIVIGGTSVSEYLPDEWKKEIEMLQR